MSSSGTTFHWRERLRYAFDNTLARGTGALIAWLALISLFAIVVFAVVVLALDLRPPSQEGPTGFAEALWGNLMRTIDAGTVGGDEGWAFRGVMLLVTIFGIFIFSSLIGVLSAGLEAQIENLRKGRSRVVEKDHVLILGWSDQIFPILSELSIAGESRKDPCVVVLGHKDKVEMEDAIRGESRPGKLRVVCRSGSPSDMGDIAVTSADLARAILILSPEHDEKDRDPDIEVIKSILAITGSPKRKASKYHIVAEIRDPKNADVARMVGKDEVEVILAGDLIARVTAQTCRQSGLSIVYQELLDFGGDEIYMKAEPATFGRRYNETLLAYDHCAVIGLEKRGQDPVANPPHDTLIEEGDRLVVVAADFAAVQISPAPAPDYRLVALRDPQQHAPERTLVLGWNWRGTAIINELDQYVQAGSSVVVVASSAHVRDLVAYECRGLVHQSVEVHHADTTDRSVLDVLAITSFDHVIVICDDHVSAAEADARTLVTLLHIRDIASKAGRHIPVVSEMLDLKNRELAAVTQADDFIVSNRMVSLMMSQVAENKALAGVFADLFRSEGSEIYLKPISEYVLVGQPMTYATVVAAAAMKGQSALGFKLAHLANDSEQSFGVFVNPKKSAQVTFSPSDQIIVLSED